MISVYNFKETKIAEAPDELTKAINKYSTKYTAQVGGDMGEAEKCDIIHFHNKYKKTDRPAIIQYHSEPQRVDLTPPCKRYVINQYHATLPEYKDCGIVRNVIDFNQDMYKFKPISDKLRVGFSPSHQHQGMEWHNKGVQSTVPVLKELKQKYPDKFDYDLIMNVSLSECIRRKSNCNIIIDELATPSFHRSGLEGLALGKVTLCSLSDEIHNLAGKPPFCDPTLITGGLRQYLTHILDDYDNMIDIINDMGFSNRLWMKDNWSPEIIVQEFESIYDSLK